MMISVFQDGYNMAFVRLASNWKTDWTRVLGFYVSTTHDDIPMNASGWRLMVGVVIVKRSWHLLSIIAYL